MTEFSKARLETSPLRSDFRAGSGSTTTFYYLDEVGVEAEQVSRVANVWSKWDRSTKSLVLVLGCSMILVAVVLLVSISSFSSSNSSKSVLLQATETGDNEILQIPQGKLKWVTLQSRENRSYYAFFKVPFAKPPIGDLRFESPQPPDKWEGVRFIKEVAPQCLQKAKYSPVVEAVGDSDCLYMNIYTPKLPDSNNENATPKFPVLFYIHGGGFTDGNGSRYGGSYFMDENVVLITFQYRLGIFGFLSSEDGVFKANLGMKDQVMALKWTNDNIHLFNGDPNRIMIFGNSAGAMSVNQIMVSPMASGLFSSAITQSGPGFSAIVKPREAQLKSFQALAQEIGCWSDHSDTKRRNERVLKCLREQNASDIAVIRGPDIIFATTIEDYEAPEDDKFLPDTFYNLYKSGKVNQKPWMLGVNSAEWIHIAAGTLSDLEETEGLNSNWTAYAPPMFMVSYENSPVKDEISLGAKEFYFGNNAVGNETLWNLTNLLSDRDIIHGSKTQGMWMSELGVDVFLYYMSKRPAKSYSDSALIGYPFDDYGLESASAHADELQYIFNYYGYPYIPVNSKYYEFSKRLVKIWVQFASTGKPGWDPIAKDQNPIKWYELNDKPGLTTVLQKRMEFWDKFSPEELSYT